MAPDATSYIRFILNRPIDYLLAGSDLRYWLAFPITCMWHDVYKGILTSPVFDYDEQGLRLAASKDYTDASWRYLAIPHGSSRQAPFCFLLSALTVGHYDYNADVKKNKHRGQDGKDDMLRTIKDIGRIWCWALSDESREKARVSYPPANATAFQTVKWVRELGRALDIDIAMDAYFAGVPLEHIVF